MKFLLGLFEEPYVDVEVQLGEYSGGPTRKISILQGIKDKVGGEVTVNYAEGCKITTSDKPSWHKDDVQME